MCLEYREGATVQDRVRSSSRNNASAIYICVYFILFFFFFSFKRIDCDVNRTVINNEEVRVSRTAEINLVIVNTIPGNATRT